MNAIKYLFPILLFIQEFAYTQEITFQLSQEDVNFIYNEAIQKIVVSESDHFDLCCIKDYLKEYNTLSLRF